MSAEPVFELPDYDPNFDWEDDEKTPVVPQEKMEELMEKLRNEGVPVATSDRPTRPMRPIALRRMTDR